MTRPFILYHNFGLVILTFDIPELFIVAFYIWLQPFRYYVVFLKNSLFFVYQCTVFFSDGCYTWYYAQLFSLATLTCTSLIWLLYHIVTASFCFTILVSCFVLAWSSISVSSLWLFKFFSRNLGTKLAWGCSHLITFLKLSLTWSNYIFLKTTVCFSIIISSISISSDACLWYSVIFNSACLCYCDISFYFACLWYMCCSVLFLFSYHVL